MEVPLAQVVMNEPFVMFDDDLLADVKQYSIEELYESLEESLDTVEAIYSKYNFTRMEEYKIYQRELDEQFNIIIIYSSELYRRNVRYYFDPYPFDISVKCFVCCEKINATDECNTNLPLDCKISSLYSNINYTAYCKGCTPASHHINVHNGTYALTRLNQERYDCLLSHVYRNQRQPSKNIHDRIVSELKVLKRTKKIMLTRLRKPCISKEINDLMDKLLDSNGNKISLFKDYLSPDHYRKIRAGCDVSEWDLGEQEQILECLNKYKSSIKCV